VLRGLSFITAGYEKWHNSFFKKTSYPNRTAKTFPKGAHDDGPDVLKMAFKACDEYVNDSDWFRIDIDPDDF